MRVSRERLAIEAEATGFRPEILEKVIHLLGLLEDLAGHPYLRGRLALKGGTALNLFVFDVPRLSVDADLNYIGAADRATMLEERPRVEEALQAVFARRGYGVRRTPSDHAGGK
jgi:predicted nucleotidyltransferase component of viral defense system